MLGRFIIQMSDCTFAVSLDSELFKFPMDLDPSEMRSLYVKNLVAQEIGTIGPGV